MPKAVKRKTQPSNITAQARSDVMVQLQPLHGWPIKVTFRGAYCYVAHAGDPLCRLGFRGSGNPWDFAIYRFSRDTYGTLDLGPTQGTVLDCVRTALGAYDLL